MSGLKYHNFNFDTRARVDINRLSSDCKLKFPMRIRNVCSVEMTSMELPNSIMLFSSTAGNDYFFITVNGGPKVRLTISEGNYVAQDFEVEIRQQLVNIGINTSTAAAVSPIGFTVSKYTGKCTFEHTGTAGGPSVGAGPVSLELDFTTPSTRATNWGLGYYMGFRDKTRTLTGAGTITGPGVMNIIGERYYMLQISPNKMSNLISTSEGGVVNSGNLFTKVVLVGSVFTIVTENDNNSMNKLLYLDNPITIDELDVKLIDFYGEVVDLHECDFSFTLRIAELVHPNMPMNQSQSNF